MQNHGRSPVAKNRNYTDMNPEDDEFKYAAIAYVQANNPNAIDHSIQFDQRRGS